MTTRNQHRLCSAFAVAFALCLPALSTAGDSSAYVTLSNAPGSITAFNPAKGSLGPSFFVPLGGTLMAIAPGTKQIWEVAATETQPVSIYILDPNSGSTLANIPVNVHPTAIIMDAAGTYAYLAGANGVLVKIAVSSRRIVQEVSLGSATSSAGCMALSSDGSKLFVAAGTSSVFVLDPDSLTTLATISIPAGFTGACSIFVSGNTLLVTDQVQLLYFNATTFQQTNSAPVRESSFLFGVSPDASKIYLYTDCLCVTPNISVLDFSTGTTLVSQTFSNVDLANVLLSPDGTQILVASNPVLLVDPTTLATTKTVWSVGIPNAAAYLNANTVFMLNYAPTSGGAMAVIDQSTAEVTAVFPLGITPLSGLVADPTRDLIYAGAYYYEDGSPNVVSTKLNRIVANLPVTGGFSPAALMGGQVYGTMNSAAAFYDLATGASGFLPSALDLGSAYFVDVGLGFAPPNGRTYWAPFSVTEVGGGDANGSSQPALSFASTRIAIYSTATNSVVARLAPPGRVGPIVFSPDSSTAYIAGNNVIAVYSTQTLQNTATLKYATTFAALAISVDGSVIYASDGNAVYVLDASTGAQNQVFSLPSPASFPTMALSPDGSTLFLTNDNGHAVDLIATATGQVTVVPVSFNPTGVIVVPSN